MRKNKNVYKLYQIARVNICCVCWKAVWSVGHFASCVGKEPRFGCMRTRDAKILNANVLIVRSNQKGNKHVISSEMITWLVPFWLLRTIKMFAFGNCESLCSTLCSKWHYSNVMLMLRSLSITMLHSLCTIPYTANDHHMIR